MKKDRHPKLTEHGTPVDAKDWLYEDWKDLHEALEQAFAKIRERHKPTPQPDNPKDVT